RQEDFSIDAKITIVRDPVCDTCSVVDSTWELWRTSDDAASERVTNDAGCLGQVVVGCRQQFRSRREDEEENDRSGDVVLEESLSSSTSSLYPSRCQLEQFLLS